MSDKRPPSSRDLHNSAKRNYGGHRYDDGTSPPPPPSSSAGQQPQLQQQWMQQGLERQNQRQQQSNASPRSSRGGVVPRQHSAAPIGGLATPAGLIHTTNTTTTPVTRSTRPIPVENTTTTTASNSSHHSPPSRWENAKPGHAPPGYSSMPDHGAYSRRHPPSTSSSASSPIVAVHRSSATTTTAGGGHRPLVSGYHSSRGERPGSGHDPALSRPLPRSSSTAKAGITTADYRHSSSNNSKPSQHKDPRHDYPLRRHPPEPGMTYYGFPDQTRSRNRGTGQRRSTPPASTTSSHYQDQQQELRGHPSSGVAPVHQSPALNFPPAAPYYGDLEIEAPPLDPFMAAFQRQDHSFWSSGEFLKVLLEIHNQNRQKQNEQGVGLFDFGGSSPTVINVQQAQQVFRALSRVFQTSNRLASEVIRLWFTHCGPQRFEYVGGGPGNQPSPKSTMNLRDRLSLNTFYPGSNDQGLPFCDKICLFPDARNLLRELLKVWSAMAAKGEEGVPFPAEIDQRIVVYQTWKEAATHQGGWITLKQFLEVFTSPQRYDSKKKSPTLDGESTKRSVATNHQKSTAVVTARSLDQGLLSLPSDVVGVVAWFLDVPSLFTIRQVPNHALRRSLAHGCEEMYIPLLLSKPAGQSGHYCLIYKYFPMVFESSSSPWGGGALLFAGYTGVWERPDEVPSEYYGMFQAKRQTQPPRPEDQRRRTIKARKGFLADLFRVLKYSPDHPVHKREAIARWCENEKSSFDIRYDEKTKGLPGQDNEDEEAIDEMVDDLLAYHSLLFTSKDDYHGNLPGFITSNCSVKCMQVASFNDDLVQLLDGAQYSTPPRFIPQEHEMLAPRLVEALKKDNNKIKSPKEYLEKFGGSESNAIPFSHSPLIPNISNLVQVFKLHTFNWETQAHEDRWLGAGKGLPESMETIELWGRLSLARHLKLILQASNLQQEGSDGANNIGRYQIKKVATADSLCRGGTSGYPRQTQFPDLSENRIRMLSRVEGYEFPPIKPELKHRCPMFCNYMLQRQQDVHHHHNGDVDGVLNEPRNMFFDSHHQDTYDLLGKSSEDSGLNEVSLIENTHRRGLSASKTLTLTREDAEKLSAQEWRRLFIEGNPIVIRCKRNEELDKYPSLYGVLTSGGIGNSEEETADQSWRFFLMNCLSEKSSGGGEPPRIFHLGLNPLSGAPMAAEPYLVFTKLLTNSVDDDTTDDEDNEDGVSRHGHSRSLYRPRLGEHGLYAVDQELLGNLDETNPLWCPVAALLHPTKSTLYREVISRSSRTTSAQEDKKVNNVQQKDHHNTQQQDDECLTSSSSSSKKKKHPLESPFLLFGEEFTYSGEHREPDNSYTWAYLLHGSKKWFVQVDQEKNEWEEITQNPGDLIFLGPTTLHFVTNQATSVLISRNFHVRWDEAW